MHVSKDIVENMASATHFAKEVSMNMTAMAELFETCSDTIFTVSFHKQATIDGAKVKLDSIRLADLKDNKKVA